MLNALDGFATGKRQERKQEILTPPSILEFVRGVFGGHIALDPCAAFDEHDCPRGEVRASVYYSPPVDGLVEPWHHRTYCNPPYKHLKKWLAKACAEADRDDAPAVIVLCPVRSHRSWWRQARNDANGFVLELNPVTFVGYDATFPVPMVLLGYNCMPNEQDTKLGEFL
jgi:hypothetical protein